MHLWLHILIYGGFAGAAKIESGLINAAFGYATGRNKQSYFLGKELCNVLRLTMQKWLDRAHLRSRH